MNWLNEAVKAYKDLLNEGMEIFSNKNKAVEYANKNSTAGKKTKEIALLEWK